MTSSHTEPVISRKPQASQLIAVPDGGGAIRVEFASLPVSICDINAAPRPGLDGSDYMRDLADEHRLTSIDDDHRLVTVEA